LLLICWLLLLAAAAAAHQAGDDKKLVQAASRKKKLENRFGLERNAKGGRFKVSPVAARCSSQVQVCCAVL
jgi:hypothetical protein